MTVPPSDSPVLVDAAEQPRHAFAWMDLVRTLAAVLVAISHMRDLMWRDAMPGDAIAAKVFYLLTGFGHVWVIVFFVLSGFWITQSVVRRIDRPTFWREYLIDRLSRLWIVLLPVLLIGGVLDWLGANTWQYANYMATSGAHSISAPVADRLGLTELAGSALFLADLATGPLASAARYLWVGATLVLALGAMMAGRRLQMAWLDPLIAAAFAFFLYWLCRANPALPAWLRPAAQFGAGSSYSLYALHFPLAMAMAGWAYAGQRLEPSLSLFAATIAMLVAIIGIAFGFSRLTEARTGALRRALRQRFVPPGPSHG